MEYEEQGSVDGVPVHVPTDDGYTTSSARGSHSSARSTGVQSLVNPFEGTRG
ncbi:hypothetical protein [Leucobacter salsicius]|uniref:hypothetical protein n=1 Tax=Leucobacter salsicius TaxID=664638 RepID=UPI0012F8E9E7|nr:hypothetical protein [Leucobacter salsicius]